MNPDAPKGFFCLIIAPSPVQTQDTNRKHEESSCSENGMN